MKKWYLVLVVFLLAIVIGIGYPVWRSYKINAYHDEIAIHHAVYEIYGDTVGETSDGAVWISDANLYYFEKAVTLSGVDYRIFKPNTQGMDVIKVTYYDGAEFEIFDAGTVKNGKDLAYIVYSYQGRENYFSIEGFGTFSRTCKCASLGGFSGANIPIS